MNICCFYCGKETNNKKYCSNQCCNKDRSIKGNESQHGKKLEYKVICHKCSKEFIVFEFEKHHPKKEKYYCSRKCANSRIFSDLSKLKKSESNLKFFYGENYKELKKVKKEKSIKIIKKVKCPCGNEFTHTSKREHKYCSRKCINKYCLTKEKLSEYGRKGGRKSVLSQNRRSKNEIYFAELCKTKFNNVKLNEQIFNGWDADVILDDYKLAILWDGIWHHKKISEKHSLKQVQNRDRIKIKEILNFGYIPYIINDYGCFDKFFVETEFKKLIDYIAVSTGVGPSSVS